MYIGIDFFSLNFLSSIETCLITVIDIELSRETRQNVNT